MVNGTAEHHFTIPEEAAQKAPWVEELKMNQAKKNSAQGNSCPLFINIFWKIHIVSAL